jgi:hypothetical protein
MKRLLFVVWPPCELQFYTQEIAKSIGSDQWDRAMKESALENPPVSDSDLAEAEKLVSAVMDAEVKRKDVLESKASTFIVTPTVAMGIAAVVAPFAKELVTTSTLVICGIVFYVIALVHLFVSAYYAIEARRAQQFVVLSSGNVHDLLAMTRHDRLVARLAYVKMNEPALTNKSNELTVSEDLHLRGLAFLIFSALLT